MQVNGEAYKAQSNYTGHVIPDGLLIFNRDCPEATSLEKQREMFQANAKEIMNVLTACLPQGTLDQLLILLLQDRASLYVIREPRRGEESETK